MPVCTISYMPRNGLREDLERDHLASALIAALPDMVVVALAEVAGVSIDRKQMTINIHAFHPQAYNQPALEVVVGPGRGHDDVVYMHRAEVREHLRAQLDAWLRLRPGLCDPAELTDADVDVRCIEMCGVNFDVRTGEVGSRWGGPGED